MSKLPHQSPSPLFRSRRPQVTRRRPVQAVLEALEPRQMLAADAYFVGVTAPQGMANTQDLVTFDANSPTSFTDKGAVTGVASGFVIEALTRDPGNNTYYALAVDGSGNANIYKFNIDTLAAKLIGNFNGFNFPQAPDGFFASDDHYLYLFDGSNNSYRGSESGTFQPRTATTGTIPVAQAAAVDGTASSPLAYGLISGSQTTTTDGQTFTSAGYAGPTFSSTTGLQVAAVQKGVSFYATGSTTVGSTSEYDLFSYNVGNATLTKVATLPQALTGFADRVLQPTLHVSGISGNVTAGSTQTITVTADPGDGSTNTGYTGTVHFTSSDGQAVLPADAMLSNGTGTFQVTFKTAGMQSITATDTANATDTGTESGISVVAGATTHYVVTGATNETAGGVEAVTVKAADAYGNTNANDTSTAHITSSDSQATLPADAALTGGTGTFNVTLKTAGTQSITATSTGSAAITGSQSGIVVSAASATNFAITGPSTATAGTAGTYTLTAYDTYHNAATSYQGTVHVTSTDAQATLPADFAVTGGTGTFNATLKTAGTQTISASDAANPTVTGTSAGIKVTAAALDHLVLKLPATATAGSAQTLTITGEDAYGNVATGSSDSVNFSSSDAQAAYPASINLAGGVASVPFTPKTAGMQTVTVTAAATPSITKSATTTVAAAAASRFAVSGAAGGAAGTTETFTVTAQDPYGNTATGYAGTVHFTSNDPKATLPADATLSDGTGTFSGILVKAGDDSITATDTATASITGTESDIIVTPGAAASLSVAGPSTVVAGGVYTYTVAAQDAYGNLAVSDNDSVKFASSDAAASLPAAATLASGETSFSATLRTVGGQTITATDGTNATITGTSPAITVRAAIAGTVFLDTNANGVQDNGEKGLAGRVLYLDLNGSGTYSSGAPTATTDANGHFSFPGIAAGSATVRQLIAQDTSYRYIDTQLTTNADSSLSLGIVPFSPIAPVLITPNPFTNNPGTTANARFVQSLYRTVLGRTAASDEVAGWLTQLNNGATPGQVAAGFINSQEHRTEQVETFYQSFLHRAADGSLTHWVRLLQSGVSEQAVINAFLDSSEYQSKHTDSSLYVHDLYLDVLGRQGSDAEVAGWQSAMASGTSRAGVAAAFVASGEASDQVIEGLYVASLHRSVDAPGLNHWKTMLSQGASASSVAIGILGSAEFSTDAKNSSSS